MSTTSPSSVTACDQAGPAPGTEPSAEHDLITDHLGLARALAARFAGRGPEQDDLIQVAYLGLVQAAQRYDPERGTFASFATPTIVGEVKRHFRDRGWMVRPPRWIQELQIQAREVVDDHLQSESAPPDDATIADELHTTTGRVREARNARGCFDAKSFDTPVRATGRPLSETLASDDVDFHRVDDLITLRPAYRDLSASDRDLLKKRFVDDRTQADIADSLGISQMQVSRRLKGLMVTLRSSMTSADA